MNQVHQLSILNWTWISFPNRTTRIENNWSWFRSSPTGAFNEIEKPHKTLFTKFRRPIYRTQSAWLFQAIPDIITITFLIEAQSTGKKNTRSRISYRNPPQGSSGSNNGELFLWIEQSSIQGFIYFTWIIFRNNCSSSRNLL